ncbi:MAG TPA: hypothetical protein VNW73_06820, partial [Ktedonobacteraceae bacterium]|nr:hypothetical protein [Ktedonobacteraceae bacterium]
PLRVDRAARSGSLKLIATRLGVSSDAGSRELSYISDLKDQSPVKAKVLLAQSDTRPSYNCPLN